jgi:hypothetical protein
MLTTSPPPSGWGLRVTRRPLTSVPLGLRFDSHHCPASKRSSPCRRDAAGSATMIRFPSSRPKGTGESWKTSRRLRPGPVGIWTWIGVIGRGRAGAWGRGLGQHTAARKAG